MLISSTKVEDPETSHDTFWQGTMSNCLLARLMALSTTQNPKIWLCKVVEKTILYNLARPDFWVFGFLEGHLEGH